MEALTPPLSAVTLPRPAMRLRPESLAYIVFLSALGGITPLSIDMGLPALGNIGTSLQVTPAAARLTLSFFLAGFAVGPVALGPLSDRFGRRPVLLGGIGLFALAGLGCAFSTSLPVLLFWRLLEGIGAGAGSTLSLAIVRDLFDGATARVRLSYVGTVGTIAPMIAPTLGAIVLAFAGWRSIYGFLALAGFLLLAAIALGFNETHRGMDATALQPRRLVENYARILRNPITLGYTLVGALSFACMFSYITSSPLVMMGVLGVSPTLYGLTFAATALGIMSGGFINGRLSRRRVPAHTLLTIGLTFSVTTAALLIIVSNSAYVSLATILPLLVLNTFSAGFITPNASQGALHPMPDIAGAASAVLNSTRMLAGAIAGLLASYFFDGSSAHAMAELMAFFSAASFTVYFTLVRPAERHLAS